MDVIIILQLYAQCDLTQPNLTKVNYLENSYLTSNNYITVNKNII